MVNLTTWKNMLDLNMTQNVINAFANTKKTYPYFAGDLDVTQWTTMGYQMGNIPPVDEIPVGQGPSESEIPMGHSFSVSMKKWGFDIVIPDEVATFANNIEAVLSWLNNSGQVEGKVRAFTQRIEMLVARAVAYANTTTYYSAPDGYQLCYALHPIVPGSSTTFSNIAASTGLDLNPANVASLCAIIANTPDLDGQPADLLESYKWYLYCNNSQRDKANRVLKSDKMATFMVNDINALSIGTGLSRDPIVWARLGTTYQGADNNDWGLVCPDMKPLNVYWGKRPRYRSFIDDKTQNYHFIADAYFNLQANEPRGIFMNNYA